MSGGFLRAEGLEADWTVSPPGVSAIKALEEGRADVIQSAPSQTFTTLAKGETPTAIHFAQINEMDGFFVTGRAPVRDFDWKRLEGSEVILFGGGQPLAMFKYACHKAGIDFAKLKVKPYQLCPFGFVMRVTKLRPLRQPRSSERRQPAGDHTRQGGECRDIGRVQLSLQLR